MQVLVDTSVWSVGLRRKRGQLSGAEESHRAELAELIQEARVRMIGPIRQELLSGIREEAQYARLRQFLRAFRDETMATEDYEAAARLSNQSRARGISGSATDFLICAVAVRRHWHIFTRDEDFTRYKAVIPVVLHSPRA